MPDPGRPLAIESPEKMWEHFTTYRDTCKDNVFLVQDYVGKDADEVYRRKERPLTYEGFCNWCEENDIITSPDHYFNNYQGRYEQFIPICSRIKRVIRQDQIEGGLVGIYNPSITQRLNSLTEKSESNNSLNVTGVSFSFNRQPGNDPVKPIDDAGKAD